MELGITIALGIALALCIALLAYGAWLCLSELGRTPEISADEEPLEKGEKS